MKIERIEEYDERFEKDIIDQHGAYVINDETYAFQVLDRDTCRVTFSNINDLNEAIEEYRFFGGHISCFVDQNGKILKEYDKVSFFDMKLEDIYVSQFYVSEEKVKRLLPYVNEFLIPVAKIDGKIVSLDGHTRMKIAQLKGISHVSCYYEEAGDYAKDFMEEAQQRGIFHVYDMPLLSKKEYEEKWHRFCDDFFEQRKVL